MAVVLGVRITGSPRPNDCEAGTLAMATSRATPRTLVLFGGLRRSQSMSRGLGS